jgi:hypothetical protein
MRTKSSWLAAGVAIVAASVGLLSTTTNAAAPGTPPVAAATMTPPTGTSSTSFTVLPPSAATCPGDAVAGYRLNSFIVPITKDPATLTYDVNGPTTNGSDNIYPLVSTTGSPFAMATSLGVGNGLITGIPTFNWSAFVGALPAGDYVVGIACTLATAGVVNTVTYFSTAITLTSDLSYSPVTPPEQVPEVPLNVLLPISAAAILGGGFVIARKRHRQTLA